MALIPSSKYSGQVTTGDGGWPYGKAKNVTVAGDGTGTPLEADWVNDVWGFLQALLSASFVFPSGQPDSALASQYKEALDTLYATKEDVGNSGVEYTGRIQFGDSGTRAVDWETGPAGAVTLGDNGTSMSLTFANGVADRGQTTVHITGEGSTCNVSWAYAWNSNTVLIIYAWRNVDGAAQDLTTSVSNQLGASIHIRGPV